MFCTQTDKQLHGREGRKSLSGPEHSFLHLAPTVMGIKCNEHPSTIPAAASLSFHTVFSLGRGWKLGEATWARVGESTEVSKISFWAILFSLLFSLSYTRSYPSDFQSLHGDWNETATSSARFEDWLVINTKNRTYSQGVHMAASGVCCSDTQSGSCVADIAALWSPQSALDTLLYCRVETQNWHQHNLHLH